MSSVLDLLAGCALLVSGALALGWSVVWVMLTFGLALTGKPSVATTGIPQPLKDRGWGVVGVSYRLSPKVTPRQEANGTMYRLQVVSLSDKQAHAICKTLKAHSQACVVLAPGH